MVRKKPNFSPLIIVVVIVFVLFIILFARGEEGKVYISSYNPEQGDTILIKIGSGHLNVSGYFDDKDISFIHNKNWVAFLGIDAEAKPGDHKLKLSLSGKESEININVKKREFPSIPMIVTKALRDKGYTAKKVVDNIRNKDNPSINKVLESFTPVAYFNSPFEFPLKEINESGLSFGELIKGKDYELQHFGVDLRAKLNTEVFAVNDGKIVLADNLSNYGKTIIIDHGLGIYSLYLHLNSFKASLGQMVKKDQVIGLSGSSGYSTAPHLHFSIRDNSARIDPILFINTSRNTITGNLAIIGRYLPDIFRRLINKY